MTDLIVAQRPGDQIARPSTHHQQGDTVTDKPYTDADVLDLQDVIADARIRGIGTGTYSMARAILEAGYRLPAEHHLPLLALDAGEVAALIGAAAADGRGWSESAWRSAMDKLAEPRRD